MTHRAHLISTGPEDDAAIVSLHDLATILARHADTTIVGGHMVSILATVFPAPGLVERHTGDADAGLPVELAASGAIHAALTSAGYTADSGNRYIKADASTPKPAIDLLIPARDGRFRPQTEGGRAFDATPGLALALNSTIRVEVQATMSDARELEFNLSVPTPEIAVILKSYSWASRSATKDIIDLSNLLHVVDHHGPEAIGGWRLNEPILIGSRLDAARHLHTLADAVEANPRRQRGPIDSRKLVVLIRRLVSRPS